MRYALALAALLPTAAFAQVQCVPYQAAIDHLAKNHNEIPIASMDQGGVQVLIFVSPNGSSWTVAIKKGDDLCAIADGTDFRPIRPGGQIPGDPSRPS